MGINVFIASAIGLIIGGQDLATKSFLQFTRIQEQQADRFALETMKKNKISVFPLKIRQISYSFSFC